MVLIQYFFHCIFQIKLVFVILFLALFPAPALHQNRKVGFHFKLAISHWKPHWALLVPLFSGGKYFFSLSEGEYAENLLSFSPRDGWDDAFGRGQALGLWGVMAFTYPLLLAEVQEMWALCQPPSFQRFLTAGAAAHDLVSSVLRPSGYIGSWQQLFGLRDALNPNAVVRKAQHLSSFGTWQCSLRLFRHSHLLKVFAVSVMPREFSAALKGKLGSIHAEPHGDGYLDTKLFWWVSLFFQQLLMECQLCVKHFARW